MVVSESQEENYCTKISNGNTFIFSDVTAEKGGRGEYLRPHELLCAGFASCLNITARMILEHKNIKYEKIIVKVDLDKSQENRTKFIYNVDIIGDMSSETKRAVLKLLKKCPVRKTLSSEIEFEMK